MRRPDLIDLIRYVPGSKLAEVAAAVEAMLIDYHGPGLCDCCGRTIEDIHGRPACGGTVRIEGDILPCANKGRYWIAT